MKNGEFYFSGCSRLVIDVNDGLRIIESDENFYSMFGYSVEAVKECKLTVASIMEADEIGRVRDDVAAQLTVDSTAFFQAKLRHRNGNYIMADIFLERVVNPSNKHKEVKILIIKDKEKGSSEISDVIMKQIPAGIAVFGVTEDNIVIQNANAEFYKVIGFKDEQDFFINNGESFQTIISDEDFENLMVRFNLAISDDDAFEYKTKINVGTKEIWVILKARHLNKAMNTQYFQVHVADITAYQQLQFELNYEKQLALGDGIANGIIFKYYAQTDTLSMPIKNLFGRSDDEGLIEHFYLEEKWKEFVIEADRERVASEWEKALTKPGRGEFIFRNHEHAIGEDEWYKCYYKNNATESTPSSWIMGRFVNITNEKESENELEKKSQHDSITGFYNYHNFVRVVKEQSMEPNIKKLAMIVIKIKNLGSINKQFGSMFTDTVIQNVARKIYTLVRQTDVLGRLNQNTFVIALKNVDSEVLYIKAKELCNSVSAEYSGEIENLSIESCAGVYETTNVTCFEDLFTMAYSAMDYASQQENKCVVSYRENMPLVDVTTEEFEKELYYRIENYDVDMLSFAFGLMLNSKDIVSSINMLLQRIAVRYRLDEIIIVTVDSENKEYYMPHRYSSRYGFVEPKALSSRVAELCEKSVNLYDMKGMAAYPDVQDKEWLELLEDSDIRARAMVGCAYHIDENLAGYIGFVDSKGSREWTEYVLGTFYEMTNIITVFLSINKRNEQSNARIQDLENRDALTGLYNYAAFKAKANQLLEENPEQEFTVLFTDMNSFAFINDTYGQEAGDDVLRSFAHFMTDHELELFATCRVYSDYFVTIRNSYDLETEFELVNRINDEFVKTIHEKYPMCNIKLSTGILKLKYGDCNIETAIDNANMARKNSKETNNICVVYDESLRITRKKEHQLTGALQDALDNGEFKLYLQPKFYLDSKEVYGAEALVRWVTDDGVIHYPDEFIPMFERRGLIVQVDFYMYEQVLQLMQGWKKKGRDLIPISVNFSRIHVNYRNFVDELVKLADFYEIPTNMLEIEITESAISETNEALINVLTSIRNKGFIVNMDDFGTGLSSLNMLLNAPVDIVKVDKSFLQNSIDSKRRQYISHLAGLITSADKTIVFEGVETDEQAEFLLECGYSKAQGYLLDKPIPANDFEDKYIK